MRIQADSMSALGLRSVECQAQEVSASSAECQGLIGCAAPKPGP